MPKQKKAPKRVLIVEDDALLLRVLSEAFTNENFEVTTVEDGLKVAEGVKNFSPDIILLDLIIPGIDGFEVLKRLKADAGTKKIPVVILSNLEQVGDVKSGKALGADEYFIKANIEMSELVKYVKIRLGI